MTATRRPRKGVSRAKGRSVRVASAIDRHGEAVAVGTSVRILEVTESLRDRLSKKEWTELQTMVGEVFTVYEIDEYGAAWVEKVWHDRRGKRRFSHSYALESREMEAVAPKVRTAQGAPR